MNEDYKELVEYLDKKFIKIDEEFVGVKSQIVGVKSQISDLDSKINDLKNNKADKEDINNLMNAVDAYAKKADDFFQELVMLSHKVDRHEKWLLQIAEKLGIKLEY